MSLPYETFLKDTTSSYPEFHSSLARLDVLACIRESLCSTLLILRGQDLGFPNDFIAHNSTKQKYSENLLVTATSQWMTIHLKTIS